MKNSSPHHDDTTRLLRAATCAAAGCCDLVERRQRLLIALGEIVQADAGHWAWGRGNPQTSTITPVAMIEFGYTLEQRTLIVEHGLSDDGMRLFQQRAMKFFDQRRQIVVKRRDVCPDSEWRTTPHLVEYVEKLGLDAWIEAVRYLADDTWCCIHLMRNTGREEFGDREAAILDTALAGVEWFHAQVDESYPADKFVGLSPRQRTVLLMQLDGLSRKEIAVCLGISEHTVDDHLKVVFKHFDVHSALELAARFLRSA